MSSANESERSFPDPSKTTGTDAGLVTVRQLAEHVGVTPEAVRQWRKNGLPPRGRARVRGRHTDLFDLREAEAWIARNTGTGRGGKIPTAEPVVLELDGKPVTDEDAINLRGLIASRDQPPPDAMTPEEAVLKCTHHELRVLAALHEDLGFTQAAAARLRTLFDAERLALENRKAAGHVIDREDAIREMSRHIGAIVERLKTIPARLPSQITAACGADPSTSAEVELVLAREIEAVLNIAHADLFDDEDDS